jgi:hypothetical protein
VFEQRIRLDPLQRHFLRGGNAQILPLDVYSQTAL